MTDDRKKLLTGACEHCKHWCITSYGDATTCLGICDKLSHEFNSTAMTPDDFVCAHYEQKTQRLKE